jgi:hypothetical protein
LQNKGKEPRRNKKNKIKMLLAKLMQAIKGKELMRTALVFTHVGNST